MLFNNRCISIINDDQSLQMSVRLHPIAGKRSSNHLSFSKAQQTICILTQKLPNNSFLSENMRLKNILRFITGKASQKILSLPKCGKTCGLRESV